VVNSYFLAYAKQLAYSETRKLLDGLMQSVCQSVRIYNLNQFFPAEENLTLHCTHKMDNRGGYLMFYSLE
jgi:hypothetical protein